VSLALIERLARRGVSVHALCRGHGGRLRGPVRVDPSRHAASDVGDEALLLAAVAPTWAGRDRLAAARAAAAGGAQVAVLDDGLQYPRLAKHTSLLVVDAATGVGNGRVVPAGPLREPLARARDRADAVVLVGAGAPPPDLADRPLFRLRLVPTADTAALAGRRMLAFAGIGRPEKFFATARAIGVDLAESRAFADHHAFTANELDDLEARAVRLDAALLTTAKDAARLPPERRRRVVVLEVRAAFDEPDTFAAWFDDRFPPA
jgi:tetraacyldisaccharide 4'-kinase